MSNLPFIETFVIKKKAYGIYLMNNFSQHEITLFLKSFYNSFGFRSGLDKDFFNWFYTKKPSGYCNNYVLVDVEKDNWIGGFGFSKSNYLINGEMFKGGLAVNGFINPGYEGLGLYTKLISCAVNKEEFQERVAFSFPHSANVASIKGHTKNGFSLLSKLEFYETLIIGGGLDGDGEIQENDFSALLTLDFEEFLYEREFSFTRSYEELNWRFAIRNDKNYSLLVINENALNGYIILGYYKTASAVNRCHIADYRYNSIDTLIELIKRAKRLAKEKKCNVLDILINPVSDLINIFIEDGFKSRKEGYNLFTYSQINHSIPNSASVTFGDFDVV